MLIFSLKQNILCMQNKYFFEKSTQKICTIDKTDIYLCYQNKHGANRPSAYTQNSYFLIKILFTICFSLWKQH